MVIANKTSDAEGKTYMPLPSGLRTCQFGLRSLFVTAAIVSLFAYLTIALFGQLPRVARRFTRAFASLTL